MAMVSALDAFKSSNFAPAFFLLPAEKRQALKAVYAFCRAVDDAVDEGRDAAEAKQVLDSWRGLLTDAGEMKTLTGVDGAVWSALRDAVKEHGINTRHLLDLIDGVEMDLTPRRYETMDDLKTYCYGVASTVGLACLPIFGLREPDHSFFAVQLGYAVQLTNILRDVGTDASAGRVYLPQEDLRRFHFSEEDLSRRTYNDSFVRLMRFEASRAREFYAQAFGGLPSESRRAARPALVMGEVYRRLLEEIEKNDFRVLSGPRVSVSPWRKMACVWNVWSKESS
jgi:15-cis-phytoene synthase